MKINSFIQETKQRYIELWQQPFGGFHFVVSILLVNTFGLWVPTFLNFIQNRKGFPLNDAVLNNIPAIDVSMPLFISCYFVILIALFMIIPHPKNFIYVFQAYILVTFIRMLCIFLVPLEAPLEYVDLKDPFAEMFVYAGKPINKDLFFSGHTSTMVLLVLSTPYEKLKPYFIAAAILVASLLLIQHAHYFVDVLVAPFVTVFCYRFIVLLHTVKLDLANGVIEINQKRHVINFLQKS
jgi:asparagine N-glycosylation enzyme membrane subunit Stt3